MIYLFRTLSSLTLFEEKSDIVMKVSSNETQKHYITRRNQNNMKYHQTIHNLAVRLPTNYVIIPSYPIVYTGNIVLSYHYNLRFPLYMLQL